MMTSSGRVTADVSGVVNNSIALRSDLQTGYYKVYASTLAVSTTFATILTDTNSSGKTLHIKELNIAGGITGVYYNTQIDVDGTVVRYCVSGSNTGGSSGETKFIVPIEVPHGSTYTVKVRIASSSGNYLTYGSIHGVYK